MKPKRAKKPAWKVTLDPQAISMTPIPGWTVAEPTAKTDHPTRLRLTDTHPR